MSFRSPAFFFSIALLVATSSGCGNANKTQTKKKKQEPPTLLKRVMNKAEEVKKKVKKYGDRIEKLAK